jgi:AcrR family transcriptional regulator
MSQMQGKVKSKPRKGSRRRAAHLGPKERRPQVLDAALELFFEHGYAGTSIEMIAAKIGVTRPVVYACYPDKDALFGALLDREQRRLFEQSMAALPPTPRFDDPEQMLIDGFTALLTAAAKAPAAWQIVFTSSDPALKTRAQATRRAVLGRAAELSGAILEQRKIADPEGRISQLMAQLLVGNAETAVQIMTADRRWRPQELGLTMGRLVAAMLEKGISQAGRS